MDASKRNERVNQGIEILLARMDSHPQEFEMDWQDGPYTAPGGRWDAIIHQIRSRYHFIQRAGRADIYSSAGNGTLPPLPFLSDEEVIQVYQKWESLQGPAFTRHIMQNLLDPQEETGKNLLFQRPPLPWPEVMSIQEQEQEQEEQEDVNG